MAKTITEIQAAIDAQNLDARQLINLIVDYLQANPPGGGGSIPTLAQVLAAGNDAENLDIVNVNVITIGQINGISGADINLGNNLSLQGGNIEDAENITVNNIDVGTINEQPYPPEV